MTDHRDSRDTSRRAAEEAMARLHAARLDCQIPFRDISAYERGNTGIRYAWSFDSGRPGPHVLITGLSHGNEPGGRDAVLALIDRAIKPKKGKLSLALLNVDAHAASNGLDPYGTRFVEMDFNRVWDPELLDSGKDSVELRRAREIRPLIDTVDILLDIHSTPYEATPYFVQKPGSRGIALADLIGTPRTRILFEQGSAHSPTITNYRQFSDPNATAMAVSLETGLFFAATSTACALTTAVQLLRNTGLIGADELGDLCTWTDPGPVRKVRVLFPEIVETTDIALLFRPETFEPYPEGAVVAYDGERPIGAPFDGAVPMWIKQKFEANIQAFMWGRSEPGGVS
ncbi:MAG TPA: succinylglutamate desuccinylase/aspartoacylase family protein [Devosia sp.]|nr:succinylglutamate desuccinylase/aspartoacylase family protein [Devosia sp.]